MVRRTRDSGSASLWVASLLVAGSIGALIVVKILQPDSEAIRAEFMKQLAAIERLPSDDPIGRDQRAEELLADPEYRAHAPGPYRQLERLHARLHEMALLEREARTEVPPVLDLCGKTAGLPREALQALHDTVSALLQRYASSTYGPALTRVRGELRDLLEALPSLGPAKREWIQVTRDVWIRSSEGDFTGALALLSEFEKKPAAASLPDLSAKCAEQRDLVNRKAETAARSAIKQAKELVSAGSTREAIALIEKTLARMANLSAATMLRDYRAQFR
jgi:hypothetical protein